MMAKRISQVTLCVAIICLTILELYALHVGEDGLFFSLIVGAVAATAGVKLRNLRDFMKRRRYINAREGKGFGSGRRE